MTFTVYNTYGHQKQEFRSQEPGKVLMYNCGPTVYSRPHVGNYRAFLFADVLRRWLEVLGYEVRQVMNITDVGHLQDDDPEAGEDKIDKQARREKKRSEGDHRVRGGVVPVRLSSVSVSAPRTSIRARPITSRRCSRSSMA